MKKLAITIIALITLSLGLVKALGKSSDEIMLTVTNGLNFVTSILRLQKQSTVVNPDFVASIPENDYVQNSLISDVVGTPSFKSLSESGLLGCAGHEWKEDIQAKFLNRDWLESVFQRGNPEGLIDTELTQVISDRLLVQMGAIIDLNVDVSLRGKEVYLYVESACGAERFMASESGSGNGYKLEILPLHDNQSDRLKAKFTGIWVHQSEVDLDGVLVKIIGKYEHNQSGKSYGVENYRFYEGQNLIFSFDVNSTSDWWIESDRKSVV